MSWDSWDEQNTCGLKEKHNSKKEATSGAHFCEQHSKSSHFFFSLLLLSIPTLASKIISEKGTVSRCLPNVSIDKEISASILDKVAIDLLTGLNAD
ncbi:17421_t:CDS:2 [Funneliformis geosporum]|uniref:17421_t:CDS:1 n=1 Tax=Funneliformis geosporum TaxID=1117311 RepID=A0A9W4T1G1_9GLOM|nr:17421_t:CDS:2 [Funneliformis geosporum]